MTTIVTESFPGTTINVYRHHSNPADDPKDLDYFLDGYYEIIVRSNGINPCFPKFELNILVVQPKDNERLKSQISDSGLITVTGHHDTVVEMVVTKVDHLPEAGSQRCAFVAVNFNSPDNGRWQETFICNDIIDEDMNEQSICH